MISVPVQLGSAFAFSTHSSGVRNDVPKFLLYRQEMLGYFRISGVELLVGGDVDGNVGLIVGGSVGFVVGTNVGCLVGLSVGGDVGVLVGLAVGGDVGDLVGLAVGGDVGDLVGLIVGFFGWCICGSSTTLVLVEIPVIV